MSDASQATQLNPRHERILEMLNRDRVVEVARLSEVLGVSAVTIRSDLDTLERRMLLRRIRGGATSVQAARFVRPLELPSQSFGAEKERIGAMAARMVRDGETIILDAGTTTRAMALALPADLRDVVVITNSLDIAISLETHAGITVMLTGGTVKKTGRNPRSRSLIPPFAGLVLAQLNADCAYLCCAGVDADRGFTNAHFEEVEIKRAMLAAARRVVVLGDHGKLGHVAGARIAGLEEVSTLVTDAGAGPSDVAALTAAGLDVILA
ncbi:DeoR/GlpR family DNA-binding transcription regulator [Roseicyclus persicicus]|uniref:DeoR/GlpR transcriptional regulator n=1 Tax=Roseicyclus persicicus TaxID=2650661 RepID=A0A7X6JYB0_9RHOB|nr:DeoR/GlpR family DNA-binding transcription regulator [Roseibacterium persicicum]NKX43618.1 DeoR/GlpR transcriptional regulator [Roseibacterium persicicum]